MTMGEIVDLESYRRRRKRRSIKTESSERRPRGDRRQPSGDRPHPRPGPREVGGTDSNQTARIESDEPADE
jgi:hypothetical protein